MVQRHRFGRFELLPVERRLLADGQPVTLGARAFDVLLALVERRERLVTKAELLDVVWPGLVVEEANLPVQVSALRKLIGPDAVATIPGRGYRFALAVDSGYAVASRPNVPPAALPGTPQTALPIAPPSLIGRGADLIAIDTLLREHRLVSLIGPGGVGKSALAQALLHSRRHDFEHGVAWVDLAAVADPARVVGSVCAALGLNITAAEPLHALVGALQPLHCLVALDNAEQVAAEAARVVQAIHDHAPGVHFVVTSQVPLKAAAEQVYRVAPLAVPGADDSIERALEHGALALFVERAHSADARFVLAERQLAAAVDLCRRLDGLPLAIELAASRMPQLGLSGLAQTIEARFDALKGGTRGAAARQQTLRAAMQWSVALLSADERAVFGRLGVFANGFTLEMAQAVVAGERFDRWAVVDALGALVDHSLVVVDGLDAPRYRLLETPRAFALELMAAPGQSPETEALRARHADAFRRYFEAACTRVQRLESSLDDWRAALLPDIDNARSACEWAAVRHAETAISLATSVAAVLGSELPHERGVLLQAVRALVFDGAGAAVQAPWHLETAIERASVQPAIALAHAQQAAMLFRGQENRLGTYRALCAELYCAPAKPSDTQQQVIDELFALEDPRWSAAVRAQGANSAACWFSARGQFDIAIEWRRRNVALHRQAGSEWRELVAQSNLMDSLLAAGHVEEAITCGNELQARLAGTRRLAALPGSRLNLAAAYLTKGDTEAARALAREGLAQAIRLSWQPYWADHLALLAALEQRPRAAAQLLGYADAAYAAIATAREVNEARAIERARAICVAALGEETVAKLQRDGARLADGDLAALALATED